MNQIVYFFLMAFFTIQFFSPLFVWRQIFMNYWFISKVKLGNKKLFNNSSPFWLLRDYILRSKKLLNFLDKRNQKNKKI